MTDTLIFIGFMFVLGVLTAIFGKNNHNDNDDNGNPKKEPPAGIAVGGMIG
jgi:hypothetical protein